MIRRALLFLATFLLWTAAAGAKTLVLRHATAFLGENLERQRDCAIEIHDGRIAHLLSEGDALPADAEVIDATGKFVLPGFVEMHAHLLLHPWDKQGNISPQFDRASTERFLRMLLAAGVTTMRDPGAPTEAAVILGERVADGKLVGPRIFTAGRMINASPFDPEPFHPVSNAQEVRAEIRFQKSVGVSFHEEMKLLTDAGISPHDVLKMATVNGARTLRLGWRSERVLAESGS